MRRIGYIALLCLIGCSNERLVKTLPPDVWVDSYSQLPTSKVDVLWIIDDSGSMAPRQDNLARNFASFIDLFAQGSIDYRMAITTTDIFTVQGSLRGNPKILSPATPNVIDAFSKNAKVGTAGSPYEAGMQAARMAIELQKQVNAPTTALYDACTMACSKPTCLDDCAKNNPVEFLRPDAFLYLIFVSDEDDESAEDVRYYWRYLETAKGVGNDATVTTAAIIGDTPTNTCHAGPGQRYHDLSALTGGELGSICDDSFAQTLEKLASNAVGLKRKFALTRVPDLTTLTVTLKYACDVPDKVLTVCDTVVRDLCTGNSTEKYIQCTPHAGGDNGWSYEGGTNTIFFAGTSMPWLRAAIEFQYYEEGKKP